MKQIARKVTNYCKDTEHNAFLINGKPQLRDSQYSMLIHVKWSNNDLEKEYPYNTNGRQLGIVVLYC